MWVFLGIPWLSWRDSVYQLACWAFWPESVVRFESVLCCCVVSLDKLCFKLSLHQHSGITFLLIQIHVKFHDISKWQETRNLARLRKRTLWTPCTYRLFLHPGYKWVNYKGKLTKCWETNPAVEKHPFQEGPGFEILCCQHCERPVTQMWLTISGVIS